MPAGEARRPGGRGAVPGPAALLQNFLGLAHPPAFYPVQVSPANLEAVVQYLALGGGTLFDSRLAAAFLEGRRQRLEGTGGGATEPAQRKEGEPGMLTGCSQPARQPAIVFREGLAQSGLCCAWLA